MTKTIKAFECTRWWADSPVTIFARDLDEVEQIYRAWVATHHADQRGEPDMIYPFSGDRLEARHLLDAAVALGTVGVGYWNSSKRAWTIAGPEDEAAGDLAPPESRVSYYLVEEEGEQDVRVFAASFAEATTLFCAWHLDQHGWGPGRFTIRKRSRWELMGEQATLRDGLEAGITGVARRDNDGAWRVLPPDWEPIYGRE